MLRLAFPLLAGALATACATGSRPEGPAARPAPPPGMEKLLGQPAEAARALLGETALDRREGMARQLQFIGACVLDLFYLPKDGGPPVATHAEARLPNGRPVAPGECLAALLRARRPG